MCRQRKYLSLQGGKPMKDRRVIVLVLDSFGIGYEPDADLFGDVGSNTLKSIVAAPCYDTPIMKQMGLFNIEGVDYVEGIEHPTSSFARYVFQHAQQSLHFLTLRSRFAHASHAQQLLFSHPKAD